MKPTSKNISFQEMTDHSEHQLLLRHLSEISTLITGATKLFEVTMEQGPQTTKFTIHCPQEYMGQLLGKQGRTIAGLRTVFLAISARMGIRSVIEVPFFPREDSPSYRK